eukprot:SAG31_NODE_754_length_12324_cov_3.930061_4_plen_501_part_00
MKTMFAIAALAATALAMPTPLVELDDMVQDAVAQKKSMDILVHLRNTCTEAAQAHKAHLLETTGKLPPKKLLRVAVHDVLVDFTQKEQAPLLARAQAAGYEAKGFWASNTVYIKMAGPDFIAKLMKDKNVRKINGNKEYSIIDNVEGATQEEKFELVDNTSERRRTQIVEYGIAITNSERAQLAGYTGEGVVTANVDTGVRWTHEALIGSYRGGGDDHDWNWIGPGSSGYPAVPEDGNGHGTHTMGTISGQPVTVGIGMAPGSQWIAAAGCNPFGSCPTADLLESLQFCGCPTRTDGSEPDCTLAPDICSNSWGGGRGQSTFWDVLGVLKEEEVVTLFSMGNSGSGGCDTANSPGDSELVISVGASDEADDIAFFSSRGPGISVPGVTRQQPHITGPGVNVVSSYNGADTQYASASGTSMSCPHVAGFVAQLLGAAPELTIEDLERLMEDTPETSGLGCSGNACECDDVPIDVFPNMVWGYGRIDVCTALEAIGESCDEQ